MRSHFSSLLLASALLALAPTAARAQGAPGPTATAIDPAWMSVDSAAKRVTFVLTAGLTPLNGALNFNGFRDGELTLVVPAGWNVVVDFSNHDGMLPHSAELIPDDGTTPLRPIAPAVPRAATKDLETGTPTGGGTEVLRFIARPAGNYRFYCAVPGHGAAGMWIRFKVDAAARAPRLVLSPRQAAGGR